ncbi:MAG: putative bifunctional diguanylate cyclase/phosphodiesterase, partial [Lysobacter sp.]
RGTVLTYAFGSLALLMLIGGLGYWLLRELAQHRAQQARIDRLHRVQAVLSGVNALIVRATQRQEVFEESCNIAVQQGKFGVAWIDAYDEATGEVWRVATAGPDADYVVPSEGPVRMGAGGHWGVIAQAIAERRTVHSNDFASMPGPHSNRRDRAIERGYRSAIALPLFSNDHVVAVLALLAREREFFDDEELKLLDELAGDVSFALDHIAAQDHINYLALYDVLTGLPNRTLFVERLGPVLQQAHEQGMLCGVAKIDIERFRAINDTLGWAGGDALLRQVAPRLQEVLGEHALLARVERDRFVFVIGGVTEAAQLAVEAREIVHKVFDTSFHLGGHEDLRIAARTGIAVFPDDGEDPATLLRNAETALARSKDTTERFLFYAREMNARVAETLALENRLRSALGADEFELHYQPKFNAGTNDMTGVEGLLRWHDPGVGMVSPEHFIPILEETGMIREVGQWALQQAIRDHRRWRDAGLDAPRIAINVSAAQLHEAAFTTDVKAAIAAAGGGAHGLDIEITESTLMTRVETNADKLAALRDLGIRIAIDDFGTGYSSLQYIAKLPLDTLKIDRSFVIGMIDNATDHTIVSSVISLAHELDLMVVAEGVETPEQADGLRALECDEMQGYLFSPPVPAAKVEEWLRKGFPQR